MRTPLYLDTARIGLMSPTARQTCFDVMQLGSTDPYSVTSTEFLKHGSCVLPDANLSEYPGLKNCQGVKELKATLRELVGAGDNHSVLVSSRSAELMKFAAILLFRYCRNVFVTDVCWPGYLNILDRIARQSHNRITICPVRQLALEHHCSANDIHDYLDREYLKSGCDGIFLPAVSHEGIRLPLYELLHGLENQDAIRFSVVDGAQEYSHTPTKLASNFCDFYLTGSHKWLGSHVPMGIGFYAKKRTKGLIETTLERMVKEGSINNSLLSFTNSIEEGRLLSHGETVSLMPLFASCGAVTDAMNFSESAFEEQLENADIVSSVARSSGWKSIRGYQNLRSGILLLKKKESQQVCASGTETKAKFHRHGVSLTAYDDGLLRLSMPREPIRDEELNTLRSALSACV